MKGLFMEADEKECPFCAEVIKAKAVVCKHCKSELSNIQPSGPQGVRLASDSFPNQTELCGPVTAQQVEEQIKALGDFDKFFTRKEMKYLPEVLRPGEQIKAMTSGMLDNNTWLIIATNQRVIFLDKGMLYGLKQLEIPLKAITAIINKQGLMFGGINITAASVTHTITMIDKKDVKRVCDVISGLVHAVNM